MIIKVCGMRDPDNIARVDEAGIDMMGFIFYDKSKRFVGHNTLPAKISSKKVGVFVNSSVEHILAIAKAWELDYIQLHGHESPSLCQIIKDLGYKVIKAISISDRDTLPEADKYEGRADMLLFDTKCSGYGGSGQTFDWSLLTEYQGKTPFLLSGGLGPDNIREIIEFKHPQFLGIDLNSKFEVTPGFKDVDMITNFIKKIRYEQSQQNQPAI